MKLIGPAACRHVDHRAQIAPILGAVEAGENLELAEEFNRRCSVSVRRVIQLIGRGHAVHQQIVRSAPGAVDADAVGSGAAVVGIHDRAHHARGGSQNLREVAGRQRNRSNRAPFDHVAQRRLFALQ